MTRIIWLFCVAAVLSPAVSANAQVVDLAGPWIIDFPQGKGMAVLKKAGGSPPTYTGQVTIPYPNAKGGYTFFIKMLSYPAYVVPGNNITFQPQSAPMIKFFMMNVSSGSSGIAWIIPSGGGDNHIRKFNNAKSPAHR